MKSFRWSGPMTQESLLYSINLAVAAILAALLTHYWWRAERGRGLGAWALAAWTMAAADLVFALRPQLPYAVARFLPTLMVTAGMAVLMVAAERSAGRRPAVGAAATAAVLHGALLAMFLTVNPESDWRTVTNGLVWGALSSVAFLRLWQAPADVRRALAVPAFVFLAHGLFHGGRLLVAASAASVATVSSAWLQVAGDVEVSLFMVALFVSLLAGHLSLRNDELRAAHGELTALSGLLPICAWCRKVRDGDGYWQQVERFFAERANVSFTHSICQTCLDAHFGPKDPAGRRDPAVAEPPGRP